MSLRRFDWNLLGLALALSVFSLIAIASAASKVDPGIAIRQAVWVLIGVSAAVVICRIPYSFWSDFSVLAYLLGVALLGLVLVAGSTRMGATRWISVFGISLQPVELAKLTTVLWLARYLAGQPRPLPGRVAVLSFGAAALPAALVFKQPDLGSSTVFLVIWLAMVIVAGLPQPLRQQAGLGGFAASVDALEGDKTSPQRAFHQFIRKFSQSPPLSPQLKIRRAESPTRRPRVSSKICRSTD